MNRRAQGEAKSPVPRAARWLWALLFAVVGGLVCVALAAIGFIYTQTGAPADELPIRGELLATRAAVVAGMSAGAQSTRTPFQPAQNTPTATVTLTPTSTATFTATPSATPTPSETTAPSATPSHTVTPTPDDGIPDEAYVMGVTGYAQSLPLTCESRSAVDWAAFYGVTIGEMEFQNGLPLSDNPNRGFVGIPGDMRGQVPPNSYGVHAAPVAALLRDYGLSAQAFRGLGWDEVQRSVAAGDPVIAWVIGNVWEGWPMAYTASDGEALTVAAYEHTVIVTGYSPVGVTVVDGGMVYTASLERFLVSWSVLGNMGILRE